MSGLTPISSETLAGKGSVSIVFDAGAYTQIVGYLHGVTKGETMHVDVRFSIDGSTFRSDSSGYSYSGEFWDGAGSSSLSNNTSSFRILNAFGTNGLESASSIINVYDNDSERITATCLSTGLDSSGSSRTVHNGVDLAVAGPLRGVQIFPLGAAGNFSTGVIDWFGWVSEA